MTEKTTSPWLRYLRPSLRVITLHCGGKMDETRTRFCDAIPASRSASSKEVNRSLCLPTPLVKNSFFGTMLFPNFYVSSMDSKLASSVKGSRLSLSHPGGLKQDGEGIHRAFMRVGVRRGWQTARRPRRRGSHTIFS